ncbi:STAS domain-containing protein [Yinghuangia sp. YIM S09857]|uniref:STAS domain-containing protein n=1 Tax=Yinghuangia sp. YIM S09857 TaxID=3436929 RepID=UPI003F52B68D
MPRRPRPTAPKPSRGKTGSAGTAGSSASEPSRVRPTPLRTAADVDADRTVVRVAGEVDHETSLQVRDALEAALDAALDGATRVPWLHVDLAEVTFCDSAGLNVLLIARRRALENDLRFTLNPSARVLQLLNLTGTTGLFPTHTDAPA